MRRFDLLGFFTGAFLFLMVLLILGQAHGANVNLCTFLSSGGTKNLNAGDTYQLTEECPLYTSVTINGNGITINGTGPLHSHGAGVTLTVNKLVFQSSGWAALAASGGSHVVVQNNSTISCPGGSAVSAGSGSNATVQNSSITSSTYGVNLADPSTGILHGVTITGTPYAVQVNGTASSVTVDQNSFLEYTSGNGTGVGILNGASGVIHDITVRGFLNGIDIQPSNGTAEVVNCVFQDNGSSALSAVYAQNVLFSHCLVQDAVLDGVFFYHSTGIVEKSQVIGSLNTGVTFEGCSDGATIRDSLVKDSAHQGIGIVADGNNPSTPSLNIQVLNDTFAGNTLANLLIDATSAAKVQGNIFSDSSRYIPNAGIYLDGSQGILLDSALVTESSLGFEMKKSTTPTIVLSSIMGNDKNGILVYDNSFLTTEQSVFWDNGLLATGGASDPYSIFVNLGAKVNAHRCTFGPAGKWAFYNNTTNSCDVSNNYWAASDGPNVASWIRQGANGSGAHLDSSYSPPGPVTYIPFLTQAPVDNNLNLNVSLPSGGSLTWDSQLGVTLELDANPASPNLADEIVGVLRVNDTASLNLITPPDGLLAGQLYVVWVSTLLRLNSGSGSLTFYLPSQEGPVELKRREIDGSWTSLPGVWNQASHTLSFSPSNVHLLNGTFALTASPDVFYVAKTGSCGGKIPCFSSIQYGINSAEAYCIGNLTAEIYSEFVILDDPKMITLRGGWNSTFTTDLSNTTIHGSLTISNGRLILDARGLIVQ